MKTSSLVAGAVLFLVLAWSACLAHAQEPEPPAKSFSGNIHLTNKGISQIPSFTLGKPAVQFDLRLGKRRLTFEPQLRFATAGKPWDFVFRWQYRMMQTDKFRLRVALNSVLNFVTSTVTEEGEDEARDAIIGRRFVGGQILPEYSLTKNLSAGLLYLYATGIEEGALRNLHFIVLNTRLSDIKVSREWTVALNTQLYQLIIDDERGTYFSPSAVLSRKGLPLSLSALVNKSLHTHIEGDSFIWSASVIYSY